MPTKRELPDDILALETTQAVGAAMREAIDEKAKLSEKVKANGQKIRDLKTRAGQVALAAAARDHDDPPITDDDVEGDD